MASNGKLSQATVDAWAKGQKKVEEANAALAEARALVAPYAKQIHDAMGSKPFTVKNLGGKKYRAMHKKARKNEETGRETAPVYFVIPVPEFESEGSY